MTVLTGTIQGDPARELTENARLLQDQGDLRGAAEAYLAAYRQSPSGFRASRYLHCARKASPEAARLAAAFGLEALVAWPEEVWVQREAVWAHYDGFLKGLSADRASLAPEICRKGLDAARWIIKSTAEDLPLRLAVFAGARAAKALGHWHDVAELLTVLKPERLSDQPQAHAGKRLPSDRERWYVMRARALLETRRLDEALQVATAGSQAFSGSDSLARLKALAHMALGNLEQARALLETLDRRHPPQWYVKADLARLMMRQGDSASALALLCEAALLPGDAKGRIGVFEDLATLLEPREIWHACLDHLMLAWAIAITECWEHRRARCQERHEDFWSRHGDRLAQAGLDQAFEPPPFQQLLARCLTFWQIQVDELRPRQRGRIKAWNPEREFGFIELAGSPDLFFLGRNFRSRERRPEVGMPVEFEVKSSYDRKKERDSQMAVSVRPFSPPAKQVRKPIDIDSLPY
ncbi:MAG: hypothetical protein FJZ00_04875 [Candidatus Sericytochromatia bacterium]|uniref:CSD domain-containing protein n=1 Tax=Candidatus Tanganyikabacteria bacterium TaxID=2961651 RepID=A0A938BKQ3_9BACT|nr:hypothetical protein [Candidatus Tanganyikabacteria bacterium]